jgi:hypothetical protein
VGDRVEKHRGLDPETFEWLCSVMWYVDDDYQDDIGTIEAARISGKQTYPKPVVLRSIYSFIVRTRNDRSNAKRLIERNAQSGNRNWLYRGASKRPTPDRQD